MEKEKEKIKKEANNKNLKKITTIKEKEKEKEKEKDVTKKVTESATTSRRSSIPVTTLPVEKVNNKTKENIPKIIELAKDDISDLTDEQIAKKPKNTSISNISSISKQSISTTTNTTTTTSIIPTVSSGSMKILSSTIDIDSGDELKTKILAILSQASPNDGLTSRALESKLDASLQDIGIALTSLMKESKVQVLRVRRGTGETSSGNTDSQTFHLMPPERAAKLANLSDEDQAVLGMIERCDAAGIWLRSLKMNSKLQQSVLNKILRMYIMTSLIY
jgi:RNA polymerase Rpc34 subunit